MSQQFDHEKLNVYHEALAFVGVATDLLERVPKGWPFTINWTEPPPPFR